MDGVIDPLLILHIDPLPDIHITIIDYPLLLHMVFVRNPYNSLKMNYLVRFIEGSYTLRHAVIINAWHFVFSPLFCKFGFNIRGKEINFIIHTQGDCVSYY